LLNSDLENALNSAASVKLSMTVLVMLLALMAMLVL
jgi:hypothetical protein